jgi:thiamine-phosphate pyrophosphorylase
MNYDFTPAVARALQAAGEFARASGADAVLPLHLLRGLLLEEEGLPASLLKRCGVQGGLAEPPAPEAADIIEVTSLPFSSQSEEVLEHARHISADLSSDRTVTSDQLLLALVVVDAGVRKRLEDLGLEVVKLEESIYASARAPLTLDEPLSLLEERDQVDTARVIDAAANRAREAIRVIEDYCRFVLDDALLSGELKTMRHALAEALQTAYPDRFVGARDTRRDVGTTLSTSGEERRHSPLAVVEANLKRLEEALRSLEEFGKLQSHDLGKAMEALRYRAYTVEKAIVLGTTARRRLSQARLCVLLTAGRCTAALDWTISEAAAGGAEMFQLREKNLADRELIARARDVRRWTGEAGALFIMNDRPDIARLAEADGVHLGQDDLPVKEARRILGADAIIGVSTHTIEQLREAVLDGADYVGVGPTFASTTKDFPELAGLEFVRQAAAETSLPAFVIGGVNASTIDAAVVAGARRVAVSEAVCAAEEPREAAAALRKALNRAETSPEG